MSWQYSDPLNGALLAAQKPSAQNDLGIGGLSPFYSSYDPLYSRYQPRTTFFESRAPPSINIFDELDDFELEVDTDDLLNSSRYRVPSTVYKQPAYIPSYFNSTKASDVNLSDSANDYKAQLSNRSLNIEKSYKIPKKNESPNPYQNAFKPIPFDLRSTPPSSFKSDNSYQHIITSSDPNNHNSHHQRFIQYQHRLLQDKGESLGELENLKFKQKQDRLQLLEAVQTQNKQFQPLYQEHHIIKKQYSETSIPSTNADPLYSNSPTPPMMNHKHLPAKTYKPNNNDKSNIQKTLNEANGSDFYYKLKDEKDLRNKKVYHTIKDKYTTNDYKQYQKNFGFGQQFLPFEAETKQEKIDKAKKREEYSRKIKEQNLNIISKSNNNALFQNSKVLINTNSNNQINNSNSTSNIFFNSEPLANRRINELRNGNFKAREATRTK